MSEPDEASPTTFGKYELLERIGCGGMAEVYRARMTGAHGFEKIVVVKKILPAYASNPAFVKMLVAEAKISSMLHHPNIVQTYELGEVDGSHYIAMEHVAGVDWLEVLTRSAERGVRPPTEIVVFVMSEILRGLAHAHDATDASGRALNLVHRDVSPSNILVSLAGEVKLMDFGVARADLESTHEEAQTPSGRTLVKGKLAYQSPELVARQGIDHRSDLFAVGVVFFESLTLKRLFTGDSDLELLSQIRDAQIDPHLAEHPYVPEPVVQILRKALARHPNDRYESAAAFQEALLDYLFEIQVRVSQSSLKETLREILELEDPEAAQPEVSTDGKDSKPITRPTRRQGKERDSGKSTRPMRREADSALLEPPAADLTPVLGILAPDRSDHSGQVDGPTLGEVPLYEGSLEALAVPHFLYRLAIRRSTGLLELSSESVNKQVSFRSGVPVQVQSTAQQELFGELLLAQDLIDRDTLEAAVATAREAGRPLGELLVSDGVIPSHRLLRLLEEQFRTRYLELFGWQDGDYAFYPGQPEPTHTIWMGTDPFELIAEGVRTHVDGEVLEEAFADQMDLRLVHRANPHITHNNLRLSSPELRSYGRLADAPTLRLALAACESDERGALLGVAFLLEQTDLLSFVPGAP